MRLPESWMPILADELEKEYFHTLTKFVSEERSAHAVFPSDDDVFRAFGTTAYDEVRVVLLGQDPYHGDGQAHGLSFSVPVGIKPPPSLVNMFKELRSDLDVPIPTQGNLEPWARQGVLLLNTVLTVRAHEANSHRKQGWETFTDAVIRKLSERERPMVFLLWGKPAQMKKKLVDERHTILEAAHPSPLSAHAGFFGCRHFSKANRALEAFGHAAIDWNLAAQHGTLS